MTESNFELTNEQKSDLREAAADKLEEFIEYAESFGMRTTTLYECLAEIWSWEPNMAKFKENNKEKEVA